VDGDFLVHHFTGDLKVVDSLKVVAEDAAKVGGAFPATGAIRVNVPLAVGGAFDGDVFFLDNVAAAGPISVEAGRNIFLDRHVTALGDLTLLAGNWVQQSVATKADHLQLGAVVFRGNALGGETGTITV